MLIPSPPEPQAWLAGPLALLHQADWAHSISVHGSAQSPLRVHLCAWPPHRYASRLDCSASLLIAPSEWPLVFKSPPPRPLPPDSSHTAPNSPWLERSASFLRHLDCWPWQFSTWEQLHLLNSFCTQSSLRPSRSGNQITWIRQPAHTLLDPSVINFNFYPENPTLHTSPIQAVLDGDGYPDTFFSHPETLHLFNSALSTPLDLSGSLSLTYFNTHTSPQHLQHLLDLEISIAQTRYASHHTALLQC